MPTLDEAAETWRASRIDVAAQTAKMHRSDIARVFLVMPKFESLRLDEIGFADVTALVAALAEAGYKRATIKKSIDALAMMFRFYGIEQNPARDERVKLPKEAKPHVPPPLAEHIERVAEIMPRRHVLPLLVIDECGPRVNELATAVVGDLDEHRRAIRVRWTHEKNEAAHRAELPDDLPDDLFEALLATQPPREDRDLDAPLFPDLTDARLRTAINKACKATGTPQFSTARAPSPTRLALLQAHRLARRGRRPARANSKRVAADHYVYALTDYREVDRSIALARARA